MPHWSLIFFFHVTWISVKSMCLVCYSWAEIGFTNLSHHQPVITLPDYPSQQTRVSLGLLQRHLCQRNCTWTPGTWRRAWSKDTRCKDVKASSLNCIFWCPTFLYLFQHQMSLFSKLLALTSCLYSLSSSQSPSVWSPFFPNMFMSKWGNGVFSLIYLPGLLSSLLSPRVTGCGVW